MSYLSFLINVVRWRVSGGHADELKRLGVQSGQTTGGNAVLSDSVLPARTSGTDNTAVGKGALANLTSGVNCFGIGSQAGTDAVGDITTQNNTGVIGNNSTTTIYAKVALTVTSDERDKTQFQEIPWTLEMVKQLKIGEFQFRDRQTGKLHGGQRFGFSAQNVLSIEQKYLGHSVLVDCNDPNNLKLRESQMLPILVKMVQDLSGQVEQLQAQVRALSGE